MTFSPDHAGAAVRASPNINERKDGKRADTLILHYTGMETGQAAEDWLCNPDSGVSCHYLVHEDGRVVQMVREADRAWHAGKSYWRGETDLNSRSIGIEIVNGGHEFGYTDFPDRQIEAVIGLAKGIIGRHAIPQERVLAHSDVAPNRKRDPGEKFPWERLAAAGIGLWVPPVAPGGGRFLCEGDCGEPVAALQSMLALFGYDAPATGVFDTQTAAAVRAFQRHFRPRTVDGVADGSTIRTLRDILAALPSLT